jgi:predicted chitinase
MLPKISLPDISKADVKTWIGQVNVVARLLKWIIAVDLVLCILLFLPDQTREFYRLTVVSSLTDIAFLVLWVALTGAVIWFAARQIAIEADSQIQSPAKTTIFAINAVPILLGMLPIVAAALAQLASIPEPPKASSENMLEVGSIIRIQALELETNKFALRVMAAVLAFVAVTSGIGTWLIGRRTAVRSAWANGQYFSRPVTLLATVTIITVIATLFVEYPVALPQWLGIFGIIAIFAFCISSFVIHMTLLTDHYKITFFPILLIFSALIAAFNLNDNHTARSLDKDHQAAAPSILKDAGDVFIDWLKRPDRLAYAKRPETPRYPVFIVTAQGGGAYAAYNAAVFLARMQDLCPAFRHHLFAVSSVSGGSIGAATFAAALNVDKGQTGAAQQGGALESCPQIVRFLLKERAIQGLGKPGIIEQRVNDVLEADFLSPLVGATLFPDFTQAFIPYPVPQFDRARAIEYALEAAGRKMLGDGASSAKGQTLLEQDYFAHWDSQKSSPALLLNATDAGSGKRVVIAPFQLTDSQKFNDELCQLADSTDTSDAEIQDPISAKAEGRPTLTGVALPLSTAAFISARFPWVSPAATVAINNPCFGNRKIRKVRLVDGGYLDNSGVETALDLIKKIKASVETARDKDASIPQIDIHLISLTGGDFPTRSSFAFDDLLEPIRALMSGREARAYIALNRAKVSMVESAVSTSASFQRTDLRSIFYRLPLGWSLSAKTRAIIGHESGRYWDCEPGSSYVQTRPFLSNSDCIQMNVHFRINGSLGAAIDDLKEAKKFKSDFVSEANTSPKVDHEKLLGCYEEWWDGQQKEAWNTRYLGSTRARLIGSLSYQHQYFSYYQAEQIRDLLREWDRLSEKNPNVLAYVMAALSLDTSEFRRVAEVMSFDTVDDLNRVWGKDLTAIDAESSHKNPPLPPIDRKTLLNNAKQLARVVWQNKFGNKNNDDTWNYRSRGLFQIVGREQYARMTKWVGYDFISNPDAIWNRRASARVAFAHYLTWPSQSSNSRPIDLIRGDKPDWAAARVKNTDGEHDNVDEIVKRSEMFAGCIRGALPLSGR